MLNKVIVIPDSFKGTMSSIEICGTVSAAVRAHCPDCEIVNVPVADGGEGSVDCLLAACGGEKIRARVSGPFFSAVDSFYGMLPDGTAVIEMAACAGLPLAGERKSAADTTTYGVGELIADALGRGARKIILCLGGSATNDGGAGMAAALGVKFFGRNGEFIPVGRTLCDIERTDISSVRPEVRSASFVTMCDIDNPLFGENGAAYVFAPQKGVKPGETEMLDAGLRHLSDVILRDTGKDISQIPGSGAAGGCGGGSVAFLGSELRMGIETVLDTVGFDGLLNGTDLVITGEGRMDGQSLRGKVVIGVSRRCKAHGVPVAVLTGNTAGTAMDGLAEGVSGIFVTNMRGDPFRGDPEISRRDLREAAENLVNFTVALKRNEGGKNE